MPSSKSSSSSEDTKKIKKGLSMMHSVEKMIKIFMQIDENNDGFVTRDELLKHYGKIGIKQNEVDVSHSRVHVSLPTINQAWAPVYAKILFHPTLLLQ